MSLGEEISKIVEEEADHLPQEVEVRVLLKQRLPNGHVTVLGVHPNLESARMQATHRIHRTDNNETTVLDWTVRDDGINVSQNLRTGRDEKTGEDVNIRYVILKSMVWPDAHFQETA